MDPFGQQTRALHIHHKSAGTIETDIFERLYDRIDVFHNSIGELRPDLRQEIGDLQRIALDPRLTESQRGRELDRVAVAVENRRRARGIRGTRQHADKERLGECLTSSAPGAA